MTKFVDNLNKYMSEMQIKQTYLSMITGIDLSEILTGDQEISDTDIEKIARALGKPVEFFTADTIHVLQMENAEANNLSFCTRELSGKQEQVANQMLEMIKNMDEVLSAKIRFTNMAKG